MEAPSWTGRHIQVHSCTLDKRSQRPLLIPTRETTEKMESKAAARPQRGGGRGAKAAAHINPATRVEGAVCVLINAAEEEEPEPRQATSSAAA